MCYTCLNKYPVYTSNYFKNLQCEKYQKVLLDTLDKGIIGSTSTCQ